MNNEASTKQNCSFAKLFDALKNFKELILLAVFFGGAAGWVVNFFATREALEQLECFTKVSVRRLQAEGNIYNTEQLLNTARRKSREKNNFFEDAKKAPENKKNIRSDRQTTQEQIKEYKKQIGSFEKTIESEKNASKKAFTMLIESACSAKELREEILKDLKLGKF